MFGVHQSEIFERLETTRKFGLLSDYHVSWSGRGGRLTPKVKVWGNGDTTAEVVQHYVSRLLNGLVPSTRIAIGD